ncbi:MAG: hypothetical protein FIA92_11000 [Chloroflexi bacterium]|nr:hypothetical protein [Chloroflexota bacterium]
MSKRSLTAVLWAASGWTFGSLLSFAFGLPGGVDLAFSILAGGLVWWDPAGVLWAAPRLKRPAEAAGTSTLATE